MKVLQYRIQVHQPVLIAALGGDPNTVGTLPYITGAVMRGALIGRRGRGEALDITDPGIRRLFFDGHCRFLNAYPAHERQRALPVPLSWRRPKGEDNPVRDFAVSPPSDTADWQRPGAPFFVADPEETTISLLTPERRTNLHTQRDRKAGRAREDSGGIFNYEALSPGQDFIGHVLCDSAEAASEIRPLLSGAYRLGRALNTYGGVEVGFIAETSGADWRELPSGAPTGDEDIACEDGRLRLLLLSQALLRDDLGQPRLDAGMLARYLAERLTLDEVPEVESAFFGADLHAGFNRAWGLPLPQEAVLPMGSVFVFRLKGRISPSEEALARLEWEGIGARRTEGLGRILCNWRPEPQWRYREARFAQSSSARSIEIESPDGVELARRMIARRIDTRIDQAIVRRALGTDSSLRILNPPPNSQLSRLRRMVQNELLQVEPRLSGLTDFLSELRSPARKHFDRARIHGWTLREWLEFIGGITSAEQAIQELDLSVEDLPRIGNVQAEFDAVTWRRALLRLVDAVCARAAKQQTGGEAS